MMALSETTAGESYTVKWMFGIPESLDYLRSRQIEEGSRIKVIQKLGGNLIVGTEALRVAIDEDTARRIKV